MAQVEKILSIQALRGISATAVVIFHAQGGMLDFKEFGAQNALLNSHPALILFGTVGVDIFFVISGVVITLVTWDYFETLRDIPVFLKKRVIRIFPIYWLNLLPWIVWYYLQAWLFHGTNGDPEQAALFLSSFFLFPYPTPLKSTGGYALFVAWTLTFELYFYCIVAFCLCFARKYFLPLVCGIFIASHYALAAYAGLHPFLTIISDSLLMEFAYGILIGMALRKKRRIPSALCLFALCAACIVLWLELSGTWGLPGGRGYSQGIPAALIVFGVIFIEQNAKLTIPGWLVTLGNCSYSLYLIHPLIRLGMGKIWKVSGALPVVPADILILITCLVSVMAGYLCWRFVEQPLLARLSRRFIMRASFSVRERKTLLIPRQSRGIADNILVGNRLPGIKT